MGCTDIRLAMTLGLCLFHLERFPEAVEALEQAGTYNGSLNCQVRDFRAALSGRSLQQFTPPVSGHLPHLLHVAQPEVGYTDQSGQSGKPGASYLRRALPRRFVPIIDIPELGTWLPSQVFR